MPALLRKLKRSQPASNGAELDVAPKRKAAPPEPRDLFLLIPSDGGLAFRVLAFTGPAAAAAYLDRMGLPLDSRPRHVAFRALHSPVALNGATEPLEAVVLIRDIERPGVVELYSFVDMESANSFVRQEAGQRLDLRNLLMYWAAPVDLTPADLAAAPPEEEDDAAPAPTITVPLPPRPREAAPATVATAVPPATTVPPPTPRKRQQTRQPEKADTRVRVPVTSAGAFFEPEPPAPQPAAAKPQASTGMLAEIQAWGGWDGLAPLMIKSALANQGVYEDFERDPFADGRARLIVALAAIAAAFGALNSGMTSVMAHLPAFALGWGAFVYVVYGVGTQAFPGQHDKDTFRRLARCLALATTPAVLLVLGALPTYGPLFVLGAYVWVLLTTTTAVSVVLELNRDLSLIVATVGCLGLFTVSQVIPLVLV